MLHLARKAFAPAPVPFTLLHVDTGHNFPEVLAYRDAKVARAGAAARGGGGRGLPRRRTAARALRRHPQPAADRSVARRNQRAPVRRRLRRRPPRRGTRSRQGADLQPARRVRPVGPAQPAARVVVALQRQAPAGRARPGVPAVQLDRAGHLELHRARGDPAPEHLLRPRAGRVRARRHVACRRPLLPAAGGRDRRPSAWSATGPSATCPAPARSRRPRGPRRRSSSRSRPARSPSAARPAPTTGPARPPWKTASERGTSDEHLFSAPLCGSPRRVRWTTASRRWSGGCCTTARRSWPTRSRTCRPSRAAAAAVTSTSRCSPTACGPSANRASRSTSPTGTSRPTSARSSWPTARDTCSTRGTP